MMHNFINSVSPYLANLKGTGTNFLVPTGGGGSPGGGGRIRREEIVGFFFFQKKFQFLPPTLDCYWSLAATCRQGMGCSQLC